MSTLVKNKVRIALLACFVLLGMQLWFPLAIHAAELPVDIEKTIVPPTGSDDEGAASEFDLDAGLVAYHGGASRVDRAHRVTLLSASREDRSGFSLLRATGRQPSAP